MVTTDGPKRTLTIVHYTPSVSVDALIDLIDLYPEGNVHVWSRDVFWKVVYGEYVIDWTGDKSGLWDRECNKLGAYVFY